MVSFRCPVKRARYLVAGITRHGCPRCSSKEEAAQYIPSIASEVKVRGNIARFLTWLAERRVREADVNQEIVELFLREGAAKWAQKTLDGYRIAIQKVFDISIPYVHSKKETVSVQRAYRSEQIAFLCERASERLSLSIRIAAAAGLRAVELHTITPMANAQEDERPWLDERFVFREAERPYVVAGKGGLRREVRLPNDLADEMELEAIPPKIIREREINYIKHFDLIGGQAFSNAFSRLSLVALGWSTGGHGLRHRFAQDRLRELQRGGFTFESALLILAQELGHFSVTNTKYYLV